LSEKKEKRWLRPSWLYFGEATLSIVFYHKDVELDAVILPALADPAALAILLILFSLQCNKNFLS